MKHRMHPNENDKSKLLIIAQWYIPGYKAGGPIRSIQNLVELLKDNFEIYVFTADRDHGDASAYENIELNQWINNDGYSVFYADKLHLKTSFLKNIIRQVNPQVVYLNSMFSYRFFLLPLMALKQSGFRGRVILAPRGMLRTSALKFKKTKKKLFLSILRLSGLLKGIHYQATNKEEAKEIEEVLNIKSGHVHIMENVPYAGGVFKSITKKEGSVDLIYLGRIHPIKGLDFLLNVLSQVNSKVHLAIVGTIEDKDYYALCLQKLKSLPDNISVDIKYDMPFESAIERVHQSHFLVSPTHGENFGHAIFEALSSGRPVIISDQTPWRNLTDKGIGWDLSLDIPDEFISAIDAAASMNNDEYSQWSRNAFDFSQSFINNFSIKQKYLQLFGADNLNQVSKM